MYKLLLSWRYLLTRYLALASIISVMLGVATLIVVNSVMGGFSTKLKERMRGIQADILIDARSFDGFRGCAEKIELVKKLLGEKVEAVAAVIETPAMMQFYPPGASQPYTRPVRLIAIDPGRRAAVGEFGQHLQNPEHQRDPSRCFELRGDAAKRHRDRYEIDQFNEFPSTRTAIRPTPYPEEPPPPSPPELSEEYRSPDPVIPGFGIATYRDPHASANDADKDVYILRPGDEVVLLMPGQSELEAHDGTMRPNFSKPAVYGKFVITDLFKSGMSEYDGNMVFIDIKDMQRLRAMPDRATSLQIKLKNYERDAAQAVALLSQPQNFHPRFYMVQTWEQKQGPLLEAIAIERSILNILLFLIIAVAGFGILAIFFMIVVEKTRDIGILKALGASNSGVMGIFLSYGLALGLVGAGLGTALGVAITVYINEIEQWLARLTGQEVFPRDVYYFEKIPTDMQALSVLLVNAGAVLIAVAASVFPSLRAALLHPVRALRYE